MSGHQANQRLRTGLFLACVLTAGLGLAGCSDIDDMFGGASNDMSASAAPSPAGGAGAAVAPPTAEAPPTAGGGANALVATITPVTIEAGPDTGTAVNKTIQTLRGQMSGLESKLAANAQRLADLRSAGAQAAGSYQESKARITTRLQVGTTKGNPELVGEWNAAQTSLDSLSNNINQLSALGTDVTGDSSTAHFVLDQISATFNVSGAVDEDHRQLSLLEDETSQTIVLIDRLLGEVSSDVQRQTAYVANERSGLTVLASAIKNGELYGGTPGIAAAAASGVVQLSSAGTPLVVVRFDRPNVDYQQALYAALNQALQSRPNANFEVVAVSPTRGNAASVQIAQTTARRHAQEVVRSMTDMGVPASRVNVASSTDPGAAASEVRVFVR
ncbi:MAG TPA: hypothetical protein VHX92_09610 [Rhizomicrobium sp.]|jgi:hypothetical protein|nr:hypothetical protein [Rhizomicrobium sp.]